MKKMFAAASYSFNSFYNNLNAQGQMFFSIILFLIFVLSVILFVNYVIQNIKTKRKINKIKKEQADKKEQITIINRDFTSEPKESKVLENTIELEDIAKRVEGALKEETPISLTNFEEDQEKTAIISIDELMKRAKELELIDDDEKTGVNYLEKYNLEPSEIKEVVDNTINKQQEVKAFKVSQVISPIYGVKKEVIDGSEN